MSVSDMFSPSQAQRILSAAHDREKAYSTGYDDACNGRVPSWSIHGTETSYEAGYKDAAWCVYGVTGYSLATAYVLVCGARSNPC